MSFPRITMPDGTDYIPSIQEVDRYNKAVQDQLVRLVEAEQKATELKKQAVNNQDFETAAVWRDAALLFKNRQMIYMSFTE
jgi:protein-arginine kinase activator protein McsA